MIAARFSGRLVSKNGRISFVAGLPAEQPQNIDRMTGSHRLIEFCVQELDNAVNHLFLVLQFKTQTKAAKYLVKLIATEKAKFDLASNPPQKGLIAQCSGFEIGGKNNKQVKGDLELLASRQV